MCVRASRGLVEWTRHDKGVVRAGQPLEHHPATPVGHCLFVPLAVLGDVAPETGRESAPSSACDTHVPGDHADVGDQSRQPLLLPSVSEYARRVLRDVRSLAAVNDLQTLALVGWMDDRGGVI
jgi:hypothetical protein